MAICENLINFLKNIKEVGAKKSHFRYAEVFRATPGVLETT